MVRERVRRALDAPLDEVLGMDSEALGGTSAWRKGAIDLGVEECPLRAGAKRRRGSLLLNATSQWAPDLLKLTLENRAQPS